MTLNAATFVVPTDRDMIRRAHVIVIGSALTSYTQLNGQGGVETVTPISIEQVISGGKLPQTINVVEPGGTFGERTTIVFGAPQFEPGDRHLLFLRRTGPDRWAVAEMVLGKFTFSSDVAGRKLLVRDEDEIAGWDPDLRPHREPRRDADRFLRFVDSEAHGVPGVGDYFVKIDPLAPKAESIGAVTPLAGFSITSYTSVVDSTTQRGGRWNVFPNAVNWLTGGTEPGAPGNGTTAVTTGIASWDNDAGSNVNYVYAGQDNGTHTKGLAGADGANTVLFERDLSQYGITPFTCSGNSYSGTLGIGGISAASGTHTFNGESFSTITEGDVEMNKGIANCTALFTNGDWNSAVAHELGHSLGFRHSDQNRASSGACTSDPSLECSTNAIMRSSIPNGLNAALQQWDVNAVRAVYGSTAPPPPPTCTGPSITAQPQSATVQTGQSATFSVTATGTAPLSYQWFGGTPGTTPQPINGATSSSIVASTPGNYFVRVSNSCGTIDSNTVTLTSSSPPPPPPPPGDQPVPADYDGDRKTDTAIWRPSTGTWLIVLSSNGNTRSVTLGQSGDKPAPADFDGDGKADPAVYRQSSGTWFILMSSNNALTTAGFGSSADIPVPADYNGDGKADLGVYNPNTGVWSINGPVNGASSSTFGWGIPGDIPVPADYDGDGDEDVAVYRAGPSGTGGWFILNGGTDPFTWGQPGDIPVPGDYDGNGKYDRAVFRPSNGTWYVLNGGLNPLQFGQSGDTPLSR